MRRMLRWLVYALGLLLILLIGAIGFLQTGSGKRLLADNLSSLLSTPESGFRIAEIRGSIPLDMHVGAIELTDRDGVWLKAEDVTVDWSPSALLSGRIHVEEIGAGRIALLRTPVGGDTEPEPVSDEPFRLPELPDSLPPITLDRLAFPKLELGETVLGEPAVFGLKGTIRANDAGDRLTAEVDLERTDRATAFIDLEAIAALDPLALDLTLKASESGGMAAALAGRPDMENVEISLEGAGPLDAWSGTLRAKADGLASANADLSLALVEQPRLTLTGQVAPAEGALADDVAVLIGEHLSIDLDVVQTRAQAIDLRKAGVAVELATLTTEGAVDFETGDVALETHLAVPDLSPLGALAKATLSGTADARLDIGGTLSAPEGQLDLKLTEPDVDGSKASAITTGVRLTTSSPLSSDRPEFDVTVDGGAKGLSLPDVVLPDSDVAWSAQLSAPLEGAIEIERLAVETAGAALTANGAIDPTALDGQIDLALNASSLARLAEPYGQSVNGTAAIAAAVRLADQANDITVDLDASLDELAGLPPGAAELMGEKVDLKANARLDPSRSLSVDSLTVEGAAIRLRGEGRLHLDKGDLNAGVTMALSDLSALETLMPQGAAGAIELKADLGGSLDAPNADLALTSRDLVLAGEPIAALTIDLAGADLVASPNGRLQVDVTAREMPATLALAYRLADGVLDLDDIALTVPETEIGGALDVTLDGTLIDGALQGRIADLGAFEPLIGQAIAGNVDLDARLTPEDQRQNAAVTLRGRNVDGDFGALKTLDLEARIADLMAEPQVDAKATVTGFAQGTTEVDALTLAAKGGQNGLDFRLDVAGEVIEPLEVGTSGKVTFKNGLTLDLSSLEGAFAGEPLRLTRPLALRQNGSRISLAGLDLRLGDASLSGDVTIDERRADGTIDLRSLPLTWSDVFGGPALAGEVSGDVDLSGDVNAPKIVAALNVDSLVAEDVSASDVPLDISLNALLDRGRLSADLEGRGLTDNPITAAASLPARLRLQPFAFNLPEDGALDGWVDADLLLARLADLLALDEQSMSGRLSVDLTLGGTLSEPEVTGPVTLNDAEFENDATATRIHSIEMEAIASTERIDLKSFTGRTGRTGRLDADGWVELTADFPLSFTLRLDKAELMDSDEIDGRISGEIAMIGDLTSPRIEGDLTVDRAEIGIPDGGGPTLPELKVTEVGGNIVNPAEETEEEASGEQPFDPVLDIRIRLPNQIYVRGRGLESEWEGDLDITGRASEPIIVGSIGIKKGYFDFLDKRFELALGDISFSGSTPPNPIIALEARAEDDNFVAIIKLNGPADDPQLVLSSEPVLPEDEILARLLFNRNLSEIGPVEAGKLALAANRLRGGGGFDAFGEIRGILQIDTLDVVSDEEGETAVKAGKYLNDDVYVEVEKGAGDESGRARVEIELLPNIALEAETSENADSGVGVKWKLDY